MQITMTIQPSGKFRAISDSCPVLVSASGGQYRAANINNPALNTPARWGAGYFVEAEGDTPQEAEQALHEALAPHIAAMEAHNAALDARKWLLEAYNDEATKNALLALYKDGKLFTNGAGGFAKLAL